MTLKTAVKTAAQKVVFATIAPILRPILNQAIKEEGYDIEQVRQRRALEETVSFVEEQMADVPSTPDSTSLLKQAIGLSEVDEASLVCEFGVCSGATVNLLSRSLPRHTVWGFDSFVGLPEHWRDRFPKGTFARRTPPRVRSNVQLVKGLFSETLEPFLQREAGSAALLHIDCDLYSSTKTVFDAFEKRIRKGTVLVFDEYFNYPGWQEGEYQAFQEFVARTGHTYEYVGYCRYGMQVAVRII